MFQDCIIVQITSADISGALRMLENMSITVHDVKTTGDISVSCVINRRDIRQVRDRLTARGDRIRIVGRRGIIRQFQCIINRPVLVFAVLFITFLSLFLPTRILFVEVEGETAVPSRLILEKAEECGIRFGGKRRDVRSEQVKNALLSAIPELQWIGVNTSGCVATISVKEKNTSSTEQLRQGNVSSIVATQDGIITDCTVRRGNLLCKVGQAVISGQVLVSGYTDCGIVMHATHADAEIAADTLRNLQAITPAEYSVRTEEISREKRYSLIIGKKLINFCKDSGISDSTCVKMYTRKYLMLPGGHQLPISLLVEECISFQTQATLLPEERCSFLLNASARDYLVTNMVSGQILDEVVYIQPADGIYRLSGRYACNEMIGQVIYEENLHNYGESN